MRLYTPNAVLMGAVPHSLTQITTTKLDAVRRPLELLVMRLTFITRLKLCWEILTKTSGHDHAAQEKQLSTFQRGYAAGMKDARLRSE